MCCTFSVFLKKEKRLSKISARGTNDSRGVLIKRLIGDEPFDPHAECGGGAFTPGSLPRREKSVQESRRSRGTPR